MNLVVRLVTSEIITIASFTWVIGATAELIISVIGMIFLLNNRFVKLFWVVWKTRNVSIKTIEYQRKR